MVQLTSARFVSQDALDGDHMEVAILLRANGGVLGPSGDGSLMDKFNQPDLPTVQDVKKHVNKLMRKQAGRVLGNRKAREEKTVAYFP
jgi:hypothetical protein